MHRTRTRLGRAGGIPNQPPSSPPLFPFPNLTGAPKTPQKPPKTPQNSFPYPPKPSPLVPPPREPSAAERTARTCGTKVFFFFAPGLSLSLTFPTAPTPPGGSFSILPPSFRSCSNLLISLHPHPPPAPRGAPASPAASPGALLAGPGGGWTGRRLPEGFKQPGPTVEEGGGGFELMDGARWEKLIPSGS